MSNRYEIREQIGKGGLGAVYKALDTQLQREVAIKRVLSVDQATEEEVQDAAAKLIAEAQTLSSLNHPNIVTIFDVGQDDDGGFVVMELLKGETLDETVERGVLTQEDFTEVVYQTMEALIAAQANNVIHRDIKPTNIMVIWQASGKFQLKILDFGLAKFSKSPSVQTMDQEESVMGSIFFMAPEQFERGELDSRTDLYQMGCVYYNALTGQYPFNGETAPQVMNAHLQHKVIPLDQVRPDLSPSICQWVMWLINRDIIHRPADARDALKQWPRNPEPPGAIPVQALPVEATPEVHTGGVTIVRAGQQAAAPPALLIISGATGSAPLAGRLVSGATTGRLHGSATSGVGARNRHTGPLTGSIGGGRANVKKIGTSALGNNKTKWIVIASTLSAILLFVGYTTWKKGIAKDHRDRIIALASAEPATGTPADVVIAVNFLADNKATPSIKSDANKVLERLEGVGISEAILEQMKIAEDLSTRIKIAQALAERNYTPAIPTMIETFKSATTDEQRVQLLNSVRSIADLKSINEVLGALTGDHTLPVRKVFEDTVLAVLRKGGETGTIVDSLLTRVSTTSGNERKSLFRILGVLGGEKVKSRLKTIYNKEDAPEHQRDALIAYLNWPNRTVLDEVEKIITTTTDSVLKGGAERAYVRLVTLPGAEPVAEMIPLWQKAFGYATNPNDARKLMDSLVEFPSPEALKVLIEWQKHPTQGAGAKNYVQTLDKVIKSIPEIKSRENLQGNKARVGGDKRASINSFLSSLTGWVSPETWFIWSFKIAEAGSYAIEIDQATLREDPSEFVVYLGGKTFTGQSKTTPNLEKFETIRLEGTVDLAAGQIYSLVLTAGDKIQPRMMDIGAVRLVKP